MVPKIKQLLFLLLFTSALSITFLSSCSTPTDPKLLPTLTLTVNGVNSTEVFIKLSTNNVTLPASVSLSRNNKQINSFTLVTADTTIVDEGLNPNQSYTYLASIQSSNHTAVKSEAVIATTMDTTSHNFTWQMFTFGDAGAGSSTLYDVAMINENNIWAVGAIYLKDSTGQPDPNAYNAVHWNGSKWELKRIKTNACGGVVYPPIKTIFAFSSNDILFAHIDGSISHYNGIEFTNDCSLITQLNGSANKMWGRSKNDFYVVSGNGFVALYQNGQWQKIESGTNWDIYDVFGYTNSDNSQQEILCASTDQNNYSNSTILKISDKTKVDRIDLNTNRLTGSVWTDRGFPIYVCGDGIFTNKSGEWDEIKLPVNYATSKIRGNGLNDIFLCGVLGLIAHYNGGDWKVYNDVYNAVYTSVNFKGDVAAFVGWRNGKGVITVGRRN